jgi:hypothetical protein
VQIFSSGGRDQFVLEGVVVVLMTLGAALSTHLTSRATSIKFPLVSKQNMSNMSKQTGKQNIPPVYYINPHSGLIYYII